jgi:hypothetical protein
MTALDPKKHLAAFTERVHGLLIKDLTAIPEDRHDECPGGCAHPALRVVAECAAVNGLVASYLSTGRAERLPPDQREAHLNSFDTAEKALAYLEQETRKLISAFECLDESTLGDRDDTFFGRPMTRFAIAELPAVHMMYHDGQLNYLQTLHGDDKIHW